jgi:ABC-type nitrate/sulfonate/bicarbonate transport system permease component
MRRTGRSFVIPIAVLLVWELAGHTVFTPTDTTSRPSDIARAAAAAIADGSFVRATLETLGAAAGGFAIAACLGILIGVLLGLSRIARGGPDRPSSCCVRFPPSR